MLSLAAALSPASRCLSFSFCKRPGGREGMDHSLWERRSPFPPSVNLPKSSISLLFSLQTRVFSL